MTLKKREEKLAALIVKAEESAKQAVVRSTAKKEGRILVSKPRAYKKSETIIVRVHVGYFTPDDVCNDAMTFIIRTRSSDIHTPEMKALFWANGGADYMEAGLGYATAFYNLRSDKTKLIFRK